MIVTEEIGIDFDFKREVFHPYAHECRSEDCSNLIEDGDTYFFDADENVVWRCHFYCSKECSAKQILSFPVEVVYRDTRGQCCAKDCSEYLDFLGMYWKVPAVSTLACSEACATAQYNLIWGNDDGGREQTAQREIDHDYWELKRRRWK